MFFVNTLIVFFIFLIFYQIFQAVFGSLEGFQSSYQPYDTDNPQNAMILAQKNAGNIEFLKEQLNSLMSLQKEVTDISSNVVTLNDQVLALTQQQQSAATDLVGSSPPEVSGVTDEEEENTSAIPSDAYTS